MIRTTANLRNQNKKYLLPGSNFIRVKWPRQDIDSRKAFVKGKNGRIRSFTTTSLDNEWVGDKEMLSIDRSIRNGESLHEVFVRNGYSVRKNIIDMYVISLSPALIQKFGTNQIFARAQNVEYIVRKGETIYCYGISKQILSPEIWPPDITGDEKYPINYSFHTLLGSGMSREEIWDMLDDTTASLAYSR